MCQSLLASGSLCALSYVDATTPSLGSPFNSPVEAHIAGRRGCGCNGYCFLVPTPQGMGSSVSTPNLTASKMAAIVAILFLACAWGQNKQAMQVCVSPEEKYLLPHGTARIVITLKKYVIPLKLSKIHTKYRMRRWKLTL